MATQMMIGFMLLQILVGAAAGLAEEAMLSRDSQRVPILTAYFPGPGEKGLLSHKEETTSAMQILSNRATNLSAGFVSAAQGNLHLNARWPGVSGAVESIAAANEDIDRRPRHQMTDIGADEYKE